MAFVWIRDINGVDHLVHTSRIRPAKSIPNRTDKEQGDTIDIEEYIAMNTVEQSHEIENIIAPEPYDHNVENEKDVDDEDEDDDDSDDYDEDEDE